MTCYYLLCAYQHYQQLDENDDDDIKAIIYHLHTLYHDVLLPQKKDTYKNTYHELLRIQYSHLNLTNLMDDISINSTNYKDFWRNYHLVWYTHHQVEDFYSMCIMIYYTIDYNLSTHYYNVEKKNRKNQLLPSKLEKMIIFYINFLNRAFKYKKQEYISKLLLFIMCLALAQQYICFTPYYLNLLKIMQIPAQYNKKSSHNATNQSTVSTSSIYQLFYDNIQYLVKKCKKELKISKKMRGVKMEMKFLAHDRRAYYLEKYVQIFKLKDNVINQLLKDGANNMKKWTDDIILQNICYIGDQLLHAHDIYHADLYDQIQYSHEVVKQQQQQHYEEEEEEEEVLLQFNHPLRHFGFETL